MPWNEGQAAARGAGAATCAPARSPPWRSRARRLVETGLLPRPALLAPLLSLAAGLGSGQRSAFRNSLLDGLHNSSTRQSRQSHQLFLPQGAYHDPYRLDPDRFWQRRAGAGAAAAAQAHPAREQIRLHLPGQRHRHRPARQRPSTRAGWTWSAPWRWSKAGSPSTRSLGPARARATCWISSAPARRTCSSRTPRSTSRRGQPAIDYLQAALERGMHAITANKGPVVHAYAELSALAAPARPALPVRIGRDGRRADLLALPRPAARRRAARLQGHPQFHHQPDPGADGSRASPSTRPSPTARRSAWPKPTPPTTSTAGTRRSRWPRCPPC